MASYTTTFSVKNDLQYHDIEIIYFSFTVVHVVEKITTLGSAKTIVIDIQAGVKVVINQINHFNQKIPMKHLGKYTAYSMYSVE